jgi:subfamily B ATP-binding cassette protein MsbA
MNGKILYGRLLRQVVPYWHIFAGAVFAIIITALTEPALPALLKPLLDEGFIEKDPFLIKLMPFLLIIVVLVRGIAMFVSTVGMTWIASRLVLDLRTAMFNKIISLPTADFDNTSSGTLLSKITYDATRVMAAATDALIILVRDSLAVLGLLVWMFYIDWLLSLIVFTVVPFITIVVRRVSHWLREMSTATQDAMGDMTHILEETITGHKLVKVFGGQQYEKNRFQQAGDQVRRLAVKTEAISATSVFIVQLLIASALAMIIYIAAKQSATNAITVGGFVSLFTAMGMLFAPIKRLTKVNDQLQQGLAAAQSVFNLLDQASEQDVNPQTEDTLILTGSVSFDNVSFTYPGQTQSALQTITLTIQSGETVALVGASGSGKTTLANLIPRFYTVTSGEILIDDKDIKTLPLSVLRKNLALVSQEVVLFNDTVAANIAYGEMVNEPRTQIIAVAEAAYVLEFIEQMPNGLETMIGERGVKLSGGQRQRLAIARALLKNAPILIFDEATSALDAQSERQIQQALEKLRHGRTLIIIAHRLSTITQADRIVVMDKGRIVEEGTHQTLLAKEGVYAKQYHLLGNTSTHLT